MVVIGFGGVMLILCFWGVLFDVFVIFVVLGMIGFVGCDLVICVFFVVFSNV